MAGRSLGSLTVDLILNVGGWTAGMSQAERELAKRKKSIQNTFAGIQRTVLAGFAVLGGAGVIGSIVKATAEAEKAFALLANAVEASGGAAGYTAKQLADMSSDLQKVTTYSDEAIQGAEQLLLRFQSIQGVNFDRALESTLDLATALGKDLPEAATLVGKALENPVKGLTQLAKMGVTFDDAQKKLVKQLTATGQTAAAQGVILDELRQRYAGAAAAARNTFGGALEGLKNAAGDLLEAKGGLPGVTASINELSELLADPQFKAGIVALVDGLVKIIGVAAEGAARVGELFEILSRGSDNSALGELKEDLTDLDRAINGSFMNKPLKFIASNTEDLKKMREEVAQQIKLLEGPRRTARAGSTGTGSGAPAPAAVSEEFQKLEASLLEQIALHGKVGEAAKLSYQIQIGALDDIEAKDQQRLLSLARQADKLTELDAIGKETIAAMAELEKSQKETAEQFAETFKLTPESVEQAYADMAAAAETIWSESGDRIVSDSAEKFSEFALEMQRNFQDILGDGIYDAMTGKFDDILKSFEDLILKMIAQAVAADINEALFGKEGGSGGLLSSGLDWLGGIFGKAGGGPVNAGHAYRVNEAGTEMLSIPGQGDYLMMGSNSGTVTPAYATPGGSARGVTQNIYVEGSVTERTARQLSLAAGARQRSAMRLA